MDLRGGGFFWLTDPRGGGRNPKDFFVKSISWECSCEEEYLEEFNKGKILKYSLLVAVLL